MEKDLVKTSQFVLRSLTDLDLTPSIADVMNFYL